MEMLKDTKIRENVNEMKRTEEKREEGPTRIPAAISRAILKRITNGNFLFFAIK